MIVGAVRRPKTRQGKEVSEQTKPANSVSAMKIKRI
jgi:hypothetical protein